MTRWSDETLMAYADGELDDAEHAAIERALAAGDAELARRVQAQRRLREQVRAAFAPVLDEPLPARLLNATQGAPRAATVVDLAQVRAARRWHWPEWGAMAASLLLGAVVALLAMRPAAPPLELAGGALVARGELDAALDRAATAADATLRVGLSFVAKSGEYCRAFTWTGAAGLACRRGGQWQVELLAQGDAPTAGATYRPAASAWPAALLRAIDERRSGEPLDAAAEQAAAKRGWQR